jgi:hypothetical protein
VDLVNVVLAEALLVQCLGDLLRSDVVEDVPQVDAAAFLQSVGILD